MGRNRQRKCWQNLFLSLADRFFCLQSLTNKCFKGILGLFKRPKINLTYLTILNIWTCSTNKSIIKNLLYKVSRTKNRPANSIKKPLSNHSYLVQFRIGQRTRFFSTCRILPSCAVEHFLCWKIPANVFLQIPATAAMHSSYVGSLKPTFTYFFLTHWFLSIEWVPALRFRPLKWRNYQMVI